MILFLLKTTAYFNKITKPNSKQNNIMKKNLYILLFILPLVSAHAESNPFFNGYENQFVFNIGSGVNGGFLLPPPTQWVPFAMLNAQYSQPAIFFRLHARKSLNIIQTIGYGQRYNWDWEKFTIPIGIISMDIVPIHGKKWYTFIGIGAGFQVQQNDRIGSKFLFTFKFGGAYRLSDCSSIEFFAQHFSNGNTAPENNSYAFYGLGMTYNF